MQKNYKVIFPEQCKVALVEWDVPQPAAGEILVRTLVSQISTGTELTRLEANVDKDSAWINDFKYPIFPGYSNVGKVVKVGADVSEEWIGKRVLTTARHATYGVVRLSPDIKVVPDSVSSEDATYGSLGCVAMASIRAAQIRPGDTVVVFGAGLVGQLVARLAYIAGALNVFVTDVSDNRLNMLPDDPGYHKVNSTKENIKDVLMSTGKKELARVVFEVTSVPSLIETELHCLQRRGTLVITSSPKGKSLVDFEYCSRNGLTIIGGHNWAIHTPTATPADPWTRAADTEYFLELLAQNKLSVKETITHKENYKNAVAMYDMLVKDRTQALGVLLTWDD